MRGSFRCLRGQDFCVFAVYGRAADGRRVDGNRMFAGGITTSGAADDRELMGTDGRLLDVLRGTLYRQATLSDGTASVSDACFTGADNIVMCTDTTAANPVRCTPAYGSLSISGGVGDTVSYARIR